MLRHYILTAWRNLLRQRGYTILNLSGLVIGMAASLMLWHYVRYERSYDSHPANAGNIYRLELDMYQKGQLAWRSATVYPTFGPVMKNEYRDIKAFARLLQTQQVLNNGGVQFRERKLYFADSAFLRMFSVRMLSGGLGALDTPNSIVLSSNTAKRYFGDADPVGKLLTVTGNPMVLKVTGIYADLPPNSHLVMDGMISFASFNAFSNLTGDDVVDKAWGWYDFYTYFELTPNANRKAIIANIDNLSQKYDGAWYKSAKERQVRIAIDLQPLRSIHLYSKLNQEAEPNGNGDAVTLLGYIAIFILIMAWANYINLATARAIDRAKEVGIRKTSGATRGILITQFLSEALLLNGIAALLAVSLVELLQPGYQLLTGIPFSPLSLMDWQQWLFAVGMLGFGVLLAGFYPAFILSSFDPIVVLKGKFRTSNRGQLLRRGLVLFQFICTIVMLASTLVVYRQLDYMRQQDLGVNLQQTLVVQGATVGQDRELAQAYVRFRQEAERLPFVQQVAASSTVPGEEILWTSGFGHLGATQDTRHTLYRVGVDHNYLQLLQHKVMAGRVFSHEFKSDTNAVVLSEAALKLFDFASAHAALHQRLVRGRDTLLIIGVVASYHQEGLHKSNMPIAFSLNAGGYNRLALRIAGNDYAHAIQQVQSAFATAFPGQPFDYFFLDNFFDKQYQADQTFGKLFSLFASLAIFIACLGLLGLVAFNTTQRTKEIGIRKVMGASVGNISLLLSRDFLVLVVIANAIALPLMYYVMQNWLAGYPYRIALSIDLFILPGVLTLIITLATVSYQTLKAALANPVESLRSE